MKGMDGINGSLKMGRRLFDAPASSSITGEKSKLGVGNDMPDHCEEWGDG
jgi:hypothetical protein